MRKIPEDTVINLFELRFSIENVFFKDFMKQYQFPEDINQTHMKALLTLKYWGPQAMSDLSKKLNLEKGSFTPVAHKLIKKGYIVRNRNEKDKRVSILSLSEKGTEIANKFRKDHLRYIQKYVEQLSEEEKEELDDAVIILTRIIENFQGEKTDLCNRE